MKLEPPRRGPRGTSPQPATARPTRGLSLRYAMLLFATRTLARLDRQTSILRKFSSRNLPTLSGPPRTAPARLAQTPANPSAAKGDSLAPSPPRTASLAQAVQGPAVNRVSQPAGPTVPAHGLPPAHALVLAIGRPLAASGKPEPGGSRRPGTAAPISLPPALAPSLAPAVQPNPPTKASPPANAPAAHSAGKIAVNRLHCCLQQERSYATVGFAGDSVALAQGNRIPFRP